MILTKKHLREVLVSQTIQIAFLGCNETLQAIWTGRETMDRAVELSFCCNSGLSSVDCDLKYLTITTSGNELVARDCLDSSQTQSTKVDAENKLLCLDMEATEVSRCCSSEKVVLLILREGHADIISNMRASVDDLRDELTSSWNQLPKSHLFGSTDSELIVSGLT